MKVTVHLDKTLLRDLDRFVGSGVFAGRNDAVETALQEMLARLKRQRLAEACAKLDAAEEQALADEGMAGVHFGQAPPY